MIAAWMLYVNVVGALLAGGAALAERGCLVARRPVRHLWSAALLATLLAAGWCLVPRAPGGGPLTPAAPVSAAEPGTRGGAAAAPAAASPASRFVGRERWAALDRPLLALWLAASLACAAWFAGGAAVLRRRRARWPAAVLCGEPVLVSPDVGPALVGVLDPRVVVPRWVFTLSPAQQELVLAHEREHARARDPLLLAGARLLALLTPWSAPAWYAFRRLARAVELDCDLRIVRSSRAVRDYADLLIDVCAQGCTAPALRPALTGAAAAVRDRLDVLTARRPRRPGARLLAHVLPGAVIALAACRVPRAQLTPWPGAPPPPRDTATGAWRAGLAGHPRTAGQPDVTLATPGRPAAIPASSPSSADGRRAIGLPRTPSSREAAPGAWSGRSAVSRAGSGDPPPPAHLAMGQAGTTGEAGPAPPDARPADGLRPITGDAPPAGEPPGTVTALLLAADGRVLRRVQAPTSSLPHMPEVTLSRDGRRPVTLDVRGALEAVFPGERLLAIGGRTQKHGPGASASYLIWGRTE